MIIGRRRCLLLTQRPDDPADDLLQLVGVVVAVAGSGVERLHDAPA